MRTAPGCGSCPRARGFRCRRFWATQEVTETETATMSRLKRPIWATLSLYGPFCCNVTRWREVNSQRVLPVLLLRPLAHSHGAPFAFRNGRRLPCAHIYTTYERSTLPERIAYTGRSRGGRQHEPATRRHLATPTVSTSCRRRVREKDMLTRLRGSLPPTTRLRPATTPRSVLLNQLFIAFQPTSTSIGKRAL